MVIERFHGGDPIPIYRRFRDHGRLMPEGLHYVTSWITEDLTRCYQLMETDNPRLFEEWISAWRDIMDFEVLPVLSSAEVRALMSLRLEGKVD